MEPCKPREAQARHRGNAALRVMDDPASKRRTVKWQ
jgi:hypothetical protein